MKGNHFRYLPRADEPSILGIEVLGSGYSNIEAQQAYPPSKHPSDHYFDWGKGRVLQEYQIIYITSGSGMIETALSELRVFEAPFMFIVFPDIWHRYRPNSETGWQEHWFAFSGTLPKALQESGSINPKSPFYEIGHSDRMLAQAQIAHEEIENESFGFRQVAASSIMQMLALATSLPMRHREENQAMRAIIRQACFRIRERTDSSLMFEDLAAELNVGYTYFRRMFKTYTGLSPKRYHTQLKLERAKQLLRETDLSVAEIADRLNFDSPFHLSNWFKKLTNHSPSLWRKSVTDTIAEKKTSLEIIENRRQ